MTTRNLTRGVSAAFFVLASVIYAADRLVPTQYGTIQAAINAAIDGDTVIVAQGTYYENVNLGGKSITLTSTDPNDPNVVATTIIDANGSGTVVTLPDTTSPNYVLAGFTITDGNAEYGGGIHCQGSNSIITITNCDITDNYALGFGGGGGIYNEQNELTLAGCTFSGNVAECENFYSGGGGIFNQYGNLVLTDCTFSGNFVECWGAFSGGGGIYNSNGFMMLNECNFTENLVLRGNGGAIYSYDGELTLTDSKFIGNSATHEGGGLNTDYNSVTLNNCTFNGNSAEWGGGMNNSHWGATATNCTFNGNSAQQGAGVCSLYLYGGDQTLRLNNCTFNGN